MWKPISSAPKDDTKILLLDRSMEACGLCHEFVAEWISLETSDHGYNIDNDFWLLNDKDGSIFIIEGNKDLSNIYWAEYIEP